MSHRDLLTLFRIICYFAPTDVTLPESTPKEVRKVITLADSRIRITTAPTNFQCYFSQKVGDQIHLTRQVIEGEGVIIFYRPTADTLRIKEDMTCGMTFINAARSLFILVTRHDLPRQDFEINF